MEAVSLDPGLELFRAPRDDVDMTMKMGLNMGGQKLSMDMKGNFKVGTTFAGSGG